MLTKESQEYCKVDYFLSYVMCSIPRINFERRMKYRFVIFSTLDNLELEKYIIDYKNIMNCINVYKNTIKESYPGRKL